MEILAEFARTRHLEVTPVTAVQLFIAADALDVESARFAFTFVLMRIWEPYAYCICTICIAQV